MPEIDQQVLADLRAKMEKMQIEQVPLTLIKPYWRNPRINTKTVESLKTSILEYGFNVPMLLDRDGVIILGHARYKTLQQLGIEIAPAIYSDMDEKKAKEYRVADNAIQEQTEWDLPLLTQELREIERLENIGGLFSSLNYDELLHTSAGLTMTQVDEEDLERAEIGLSEIPLPSPKIEVTCPHCGEDFEMDITAIR